MDKKLTIFAGVGLLWCFALGLFSYNYNINQNIPLQETALSAEIILAKDSILPEKNSTTTPVTILAFGDMMLDRLVREKINRDGQEYPFALIKDFLKGNDIVVANAEGPFTYNKSLTLGIKDGPLSFTFSPTMLPTLKKLGFTLFSQANNHTLNFGMDGFRYSTSSIEAAGLNWFGDPRNVEVKPYVAEIRGEKIAFIGYNEFAYQGLDEVLQAITEAKSEASFVVVYPHWGDEYRLNFTTAQKKLAHEFIDAGADVVIGSHPHVSEPVEIYNNKVIFYSLGNFIFDQSSTGPTGKGLAVKISLSPDLATYDLFPLSIAKQQASHMSGDDRQKELDRLKVPIGTIIVPREHTEKIEVTENFKTLQIGNKIIHAELAITEADQMQGLSGRVSLATSTGMFFVFDHPSNWGIWMKDMNFPIDVLWISDDLKVVDIVENMSPASYPKTFTPQEQVRYVLEVPAGTVKSGAIMVGQTVVLE